MLLRERVTTAFWPLIAINCSSACSIRLLLLIASPSPMLTTIFSIFGTCIGFL